MPLPKGARVRVRTYPSGKKVRLAFMDHQVIESKNLKTGATHTPAEFKTDRRRAAKRGKKH